MNSRDRDAVAGLFRAFEVFFDDFTGVGCDGHLRKLATAFAEDRHNENPAFPVSSFIYDCGLGK